MRRYKAAPLIAPLLAALAITALTLYAYRNLAARPFAADDYQWLLNVHGLSFGDVTRKAFDPGEQSHFYRPLIWLLFWAQTRAFGLDPGGFHAMSLTLHLLNATLLGGLAYRLTPKLRIENVELRMPNRERFLNFQFSIPLLAMAIVALHPAPFEAVVWISAQSELLAAALLLLALLLWTMDDGRWTLDDGYRHSIVYRLSSIVSRWSALLATLALGLALLAKESAVIGLPLLMLLGRTPRTENPEPENRRTGEPKNHEQQTILNSQSGTLWVFLNFVLPTLATLGYVALQIMIERRNYLLAQGGYGLGAQVVLNPLRSLALIVAPFPGTEHANAAWLVPLGALVALVLLGFTIYDLRFTIGARSERSSVIGRRSSVIVILALALTLLPTAPFASPPDSRYLYLPVMAAAVLVGWTMDYGRWTIESMPELRYRPSSIVFRRGIILCSLFFVLALAWWASGELHAREGRFAAASGPGGSLWRVATAVCAESRPDRIVVIEPPVAAPHIEAIIGLACGPDVRTKIVGGDQVESAIKGHTVVIAFPNGSAEAQRRT
jgi:hypothetical protein